MTLAGIMQLALCQLDEDPADIGEYGELFKIYANTGYQIAVQDYVKPRALRSLYVDENGQGSLPGGDVVRIVTLQDGDGRDVRFALHPDGRSIHARFARNEQLAALCEVRYPDMEEDDDAPRLPPQAHPALADYICYRHLLNGNLAKQSRAQAYLNSFYSALRALRPQGQGSVTGFLHLYEVTGTGYTG